jgi:hypothetical protein
MATMKEQENPDFDAWLKAKFRGPIKPEKQDYDWSVDAKTEAERADQYRLAQARCMVRLYVAWKKLSGAESRGGGVGRTMAGLAADAAIIRPHIEEGTMTNKTAPEVLADTGRALFDEPDWQARLARALGVDRDTIRQWQRPKAMFGPAHPALDRLLALASRRRAEVARAEEELRAWLLRNRG